MGKSLKGKECGKGICQRKDGKYTARYSPRFGKRREMHFDTLPEARNWLADRRYAEIHGIPDTPTEPELERVGVITGESLVDVKPMHCKAVLNNMNAAYAGSTIRQTYIAMGTMFKAAKMNDIITKHPMDGVRFTKPVRAVSDIKYLTVEEQKKFIEVAKRSHNYRQYMFLLETGLRTSELVGLTWDAIDWQAHTLTICKTLEYRHANQYWRAGPPKTEKSYRTIPLTDHAYGILQACFDERAIRKESETLSQMLEYMDRRTGQQKKLVMHDLVFVNWRTGEPAKNSSYDTHLYKLCDETGIRRFCMHTLRHTYATRAIEYGMQPKVLQQLLGHASIKTTMDRYVHVSTDSLVNAVKQFESMNASAR